MDLDSFMNTATTKKKKGKAISVDPNYYFLHQEGQYTPSLMAEANGPLPRGTYTTRRKRRGGRKKRKSSQATATSDTETTQPPEIAKTNDAATVTPVPAVQRKPRGRKTKVETFILATFDLLQVLLDRMRPGEEAQTLLIKGISELTKLRPDV